MRQFLNLAEMMIKRRAWLLGLVQSAIILCSLLTAWMLRLDFSAGDRRIFVTAAAVLLVARLIALRMFNLQHGWWRYTGVNDALNIVKSVLLGSAAFIGCQYIVFHIQLPKSVYFLEAVLTASFLMAIRLLSRVFAESVRKDYRMAKPVLVLGAGFAAQMLLRELQRPGSGYAAVGCVDDDTSKRGLRIMGIPVLGTVDEIPKIVQIHGISEVLIAIPSARANQMRRFVDICEKAGVRFKAVPALKDFLQDEVRVTRFREVDLEDLLGRDPIDIDLATVRALIKDKVVMVTGSAGSIGSEICRQVLGFQPAKLICLDHNESGMFFLQTELSKACGDSKLLMSVADVQDTEILQRLLEIHSVEVIFHAAAYKHVPLMECNMVQAIKNNVFGLVNLVDLAERAGCESFILISSDKAVNPTSIMGCTKRIGELLLSARPSNGMRCVSVRFGNVLGSNGSLIPVLQEQIRKDEPLTITHPEIRRFFMTTREAVSLVLQAFSIGQHREILVLDMGESIKILDIAQTLIKLSGKSVDDFEINFTGLREGEKFYEELFYESEEVLPTRFVKIKCTSGRTASWSYLQQMLHELRSAVLSGEEIAIRHSLMRIVPEYVFTSYKDKENVVPVTAREIALQSKQAAGKP